MAKLKCAGCGYVHDGQSAPAACPKCGASAESFVGLDEKAASLVERSRHTNMLHCRLVDLCRQIEYVCKDGIEDKLDPGCVDVFGKSLDRVYEIMKMSMAEMAIHVGKNKWG